MTMNGSSTLHHAYFYALEQLGRDSYTPALGLGETDENEDGFLSEMVSSADGVTLNMKDDNGALAMSIDIIAKEPAQFFHPKMYMLTSMFPTEAFDHTLERYPHLNWRG
jgi:hypothetical protein